MSNARQAEDPLIPFDLLRLAHRLFEVVRKLHGRPSIRLVPLAHQADRIERAVSARIAVAKIVREQSPPARAEANAPLRNPLPLVKKIAALLKIGGRSAMPYRPGKVGMQTKNLINIQRIRGDEQLLLRIASARLQPRDVFIACDIWILAVRALARPFRHPLRSVAEKLSSPERIGKEDQQLPLIRLLP